MSEQTHTSSRSNVPRVWWLLHRSFVAVSTPLLVALGNAQSDQDKQEPWGVAARHILDLKERA